MTQPTFLGIGAPKSGTSWLHDVLGTHPEIWVPERREVHFFDRHYERGFDWYRRFFPPEEQAGRYRAIGEITPHYLYDERAPERIAAVPSVRGLIAILRDPVERAYSHYWFRARIENYRGSFEDFLAERPEATSWGLYASHLARYTARFPKDRILVLVFEQLFGDLGHTLKTLGEFLGVDSTGFPVANAGRPVNPRFVPAMRKTYAYSFSIGRWLVRRDLYGVVRWAKALGIMRLLGRRGDEAIHTPMNAETRDRLAAGYRDDIERLEQMFTLDLSGWKRIDPAVRASSSAGTPNRGGG